MIRWFEFLTFENTFKISALWKLQNSFEFLDRRISKVLYIKYKNKNESKVGIVSFH